MLMQVANLKLRVAKKLRILGPGTITGAAADDPSGIATYSQAGAQFGYTMQVFLPCQTCVQWLEWLTTAVMAGTVLAMWLSN